MVVICAILYIIFFIYITKILYCILNKKHIIYIYIYIILSEAARLRVAQLQQELGTGTGVAPGVEAGGS